MSYAWIGALLVSALVLCSVVGIGVVLRLATTPPVNDIDEAANTPSWFEALLLGRWLKALLGSNVPRLTYRRDSQGRFRRLQR